MKKVQVDKDFKTFLSKKDIIYNKYMDSSLLDQPEMIQSFEESKNAGLDSNVGKWQDIELTRFLWNENQPVENEMFPEYQFGHYVLNRQRVVKKVKEEIELQRTLRPEAPQSVYLSGCRGSGKTSVQILLARALKTEGYEVYFFESAQEIPQAASLAFKSILKDKTIKVVVLIDEVTSNADSALLTTLLKGAYPNLVTIVSAVPYYLHTKQAATFKTVLPMSDLLLRNEDEDFQALVKYSESFKTTTPELTEGICQFLLEHSGGHIFATLAFIEYFFITNDNTKRILTSMTVFRKYFLSVDFVNSPFYESVKGRCYGQLLLDSETKDISFRVLGGKEEAGDITTVSQLGLWNHKHRDFSSIFLKNVCLSTVKSDSNDVIYLDKEKSSEDNTELVIIEGLSLMDDTDFNCWYQHTGDDETSVKGEDGVAFNWAYKARSRVPNAYLQFQQSDERGAVGFYLSGIVDIAIKVMVDATKTGQHTDRNHQHYQHEIKRRNYEKFLNDKYTWKRCVLFSFVMTKNDIILPRDISIHNKVYTYLRTTNALYKGSTLIRSNAIPNLSIGERYLHGGSGGPVRAFSTTSSMVNAIRLVKQMKTCII